jgi:hypothetical protein
LDKIKFVQILENADLPENALSVLLQAKNSIFIAFVAEIISNFLCYAIKV